MARSLQGHRVTFVLSASIYPKLWTWIICVFVRGRRLNKRFKKELNVYFAMTPFEPLILFAGDLEKVQPLKGEKSFSYLRYPPKPADAKPEAEPDEFTVLPSRR